MVATSNLLLFMKVIGITGLATLAASFFCLCHGPPALTPRKDLSINRTATNDLDIELYDGDVFVVGWEADGGWALIHGGTDTTGDYNDVTITNFCGGSVTGPANGNQPVGTCTIV